METKAESGDQSFPDRKKQHEAEIAAVRAKVSALVKLVFSVLAVLLAIGALLVVFGRNISTDNSLVQAIWHIDNAIDGPFARDGGGVFVFHGHNAHKYDAVANWGLAAVVYLIVGSILRRLLMPHSTPRSRG